MRNKLFFLTVCLLCGGLLGYAWHTQRSLASAQTVYFEITPQDPQFYVQEGKAKMYENAAYARMARLANGSFILTGLTDKNLHLLGEEK